MVHCRKRIVFLSETRDTRPNSYVPSTSKSIAKMAFSIARFAQRTASHLHSMGRQNGIAVCGRAAPFGIWISQPIAGSPAQCVTQSWPRTITIFWLTRVFEIRVGRDSCTRLVVEVVQLLGSAWISKDRTTCESERADKIRSTPDLEPLDRFRLAGLNRF